MMTCDELGGLNPESGVKFFPFEAVKDQAKFEEFKKKQAELLADIEKDIKAEQQATA